MYKRTSEPLKGYVDADWANCFEDRRSYTGYIFVLGGCPISWESRKHRTVALSSIEAEYMALTEGAKKTVYVQRFLSEIGFKNLLKPSLFSDNYSAQKLVDTIVEHPIFDNRSKHIDLRHHFVRDIYVSTDQMAADILTRGLSGLKHRKCLENLGIKIIQIYILL